MYTTIASTKVLGKRKSVNADHDIGTLHLISSPEPPCSQLSGIEEPSFIRGTGGAKPILINGTLVPHTIRRYQCTLPGCSKTYTKPSRLAEHERTHTGDRPFSCEICNKAYFRESHLHAHARTHLPESSKPLICDFGNCSKRFWTTQHLKVHQDWHNGVKPFSCTAEGCSETFSKHHQLRTHICENHAHPGTKPYRCEHGSCTKSFSTNQHLRTHQKTHDANRYTCIRASCLAKSSEIPTFFPTWSALQHHIRTSHPPTCTHPTCNGRIFASQKGLRAHEKLHEQRDDEAELDAAYQSDNEDTEAQQPPKKRRRGGELGRDWKCDADGCGKDFKSKNALSTHTNVTHLGKRDFVCPDCGQSYGYKHLLQRHTTKAHTYSAGTIASDEEDDEYPQSDTVETSSAHIDAITGKTYAARAEASFTTARALYCPWPYLELLPNYTSSEIAQPGSSLSACGYAFTRAYDLRRHLRSTHGILTEKEVVDQWVMQKRM